MRKVILMLFALTILIASAWLYTDADSGGPTPSTGVADLPVSPHRAAASRYFSQ